MLFSFRLNRKVYVKNQVCYNSVYLSITYDYAKILEILISVKFYFSHEVHASDKKISTYVSGFSV